MGKELAAAAEQIFSEIAGATIEHKGGLLKCTITPAQYDEYLKGDSMGARTARALRELDKAQTACWNGTKILKKSYIVGCGGGTGNLVYGVLFMRTMTHLGNVLTVVTSTRSVKLQS